MADFNVDFYEVKESDIMDVFNEVAEGLFEGVYEFNGMASGSIIYFNKVNEPNEQVKLTFYDSLTIETHNDPSNGDDWTYIANVSLGMLPTVVKLFGEVEEEEEEW